MQLTNLCKTYILGSFSFILILTACNNHKKQQEDLQKAVIATHDSVMMDMGLLMEKKTKINEIINHLDSLKAINTSLDTVQIRTELNQQLKDLASADEEMMTWMHNFNPDYTGKSHTEIMEYLNDQQVKIDSVESSIKNTIHKSEAVIEKYK